VVIVQAAADLLGVYNSAFNDHTGWTPGVNGSTIQPMLTGGEVMGFAGGEYGVILQRQRLVRMSVTGESLAPFQYDEITPNVGCASKGSVAAHGRTVFFLSDRGFMALDDGQAIRPIGSEKVDRTFLAAVPRDDWERIYSAVDPQNKQVYWCVPGSPGTLWIYNFELDRWTTGSLQLDGIFPGFTSSTTLEQLAVIYPNLDTMPYSLDDPRWSGGAPRLYAVQAGEVGTFEGLNLEAIFEGSFAEVTPGRVTRFRALRPIGDGTTGNTITLDVRARLGDAANVKTAGDLRDSGIMPIRASGRYSRMKWTIAAEAAWSYVQGLEYEYEAGGER
jgi:hypothetical protein